VRVLRFRSDASLFEAVQQIVEHECVLVRDTTRKLTGIVPREPFVRTFTYKKVELSTSGPRMCKRWKEQASAARASVPT